MTPNNIVISNQTRLNKLKKIIRRTGVESLQIISDFDHTLSQYFVNGKKAPSFIAVLREQGYLGSDYSIQAKKLANKYKPIEADPQLCLSNKKIAMTEWWQQHFKLLIASGLSRHDVREAAKYRGIKLRPGVKEFLHTLSSKEIPLVIISANGLGVDSIKSSLSNSKGLTENVHIISNVIIWDEEGKMKGVCEPIIHTFNKDEALLQNSCFFPKIEKRKNIILIGDSLGDVNMAMGFAYNNIIRIGFLNDKIEENLESFKLAYDVVILNDGSFAYINKLLTEII